MSTTDLLAWWGALTGTAAVAWDVTKYWRSGPRLVVKLSQNMEFISPFGELYSTAPRRGEKIAIVVVTNVGDRTTTLQLLGVFGFSGLVSRIRNRPSFEGVVSNLVRDQRFAALPAELSPGTAWSGAIKQTELDEVCKEHSRVFVGVSQAGADGFTYARVRR